MGSGARRADRAAERRPGARQGRARPARSDGQPAPDAARRPALRELLRGSAAHGPHRRGVRAGRPVGGRGGRGEALRRQRLRDRAHVLRRAHRRGGPGRAVPAPVRGGGEGGRVGGDGRVQQGQRHAHDGAPRTADGRAEGALGVRRRRRLGLDGDPLDRGERPRGDGRGDARPPRKPVAGQARRSRPGGEGRRGIDRRQGARSPARGSARALEPVQLGRTLDSAGIQSPGLATVGLRWRGFRRCRSPSSAIGAG